MKNNKYVWIWDYKNKNFPFQSFTGARGTGKTFGALDGAINGEVEEKFIYMRRTATELDMLLDSAGSEGVNPFKKVNSVTNRNIILKSIRKNIAGIYDLDKDSKLIGYGVALSTISSIRGIDLSDCSDIIYDEFIPEKHVKKIKEEGLALLNAYETIARNRELEGKEPCRMWLLSNSNDIYNPIFVELNIVGIIEKMINKDKIDYYNQDRGLAIHLIANNPDYVNEKQKTALYKLTKGSQFYEMALNNAFSFNDFSNIRYNNLSGFQSICGIKKGNCTFFIYKKKGEDKLYLSYASGSGILYNIDRDNNLRAFKEIYCIMLTNYYVQNRITFESYEIKEIALSLIN